MAEGVIAPFLHWEGIDRIDWLVAGRLTWTHLRMLETLLERLEVKQVCHREAEHPPPWIEELARRKGTTLKAVRHRFHLGGGVGAIHLRSAGSCPAGGEGGDSTK